MPLQATSGAASYDAFGGGVPVVPNYIEDVFSTWLYTGNGSTQTITNGIDLAGKGGLVWTKSRSNAVSHALIDSTRGKQYLLRSDLSDAQISSGGADYITSFNADGYTLSGGWGLISDNGQNYVSWTFRNQPNFKAQLTYTGNGGTLSVSHTLGSKPGCIIIKRTDSAGDWLVITRKSDGNIYALYLNQTAGQFYDGTEGSLWTSTSVSINWINSNVAGGFNDSGASYVMYLLAHNAGGFGLTGTDNVISCGSFTGSGAGVATTVTLGYEPQFIIAKRTDAAQNWIMFDNMRGFDNTNAARLFPNLSNAESTVPAENYFTPTATGFKYGPGNSMGDTANIIYIAIRRGPMKVPTDGTKVFAPVSATNSGGSANTITTNFPTDLAVIQRTDGYFAEWFDRLRGDSQATYIRLRSANTSAEATGSFGLGFDNNTGYVDNYSWNNIGGGTSAYWNFRRAPGFFDEVCYTGTGSATTVTHNLGVVPELIITKSRSVTGRWPVWVPAWGYTDYFNYLELTQAPSNRGFNYVTAANATTYSLGADTIGYFNGSGTTYVSYLFATCPGVSKVFSFTGNGSTQTINCGFTGGARFVLLKASIATGGWFTYDTARGMTVLTDPYLQLNSTAAETATLGSVTTVSTGFAVNEAITTGVNTNGVTYIGLAIA